MSDWRDLSNIEVKRATKSSMSEGDFWQGLTSDQRSKVAKHYGFGLAVHAYQCGICGVRIVKPGLCSRCYADENPD